MKLNKFILAIFFIFLMTNCKNLVINDNDLQNKISLTSTDIYYIYKIDSINDYYLVYGRKSDSLFKIVSKKENYEVCNNYVKVGSSYHLEIESIWKRDFIINGISAAPSNFKNVKCLSFDEKTSICVERDSINDLFEVKNLKGLCIIDR